jgi:hypothetical protein
VATLALVGNKVTQQKGGVEREENFTHEKSIGVT